VMLSASLAGHLVDGLLMRSLCYGSGGEPARAAVFV